MLNLQSGDRIEFSFEDGPTTKICATVDGLLTDQDEGMGVEIEDYIARWIEITLDEPSDMDPKQILLFGTDLQYRLNGRPVTLRLKDASNDHRKCAQRNGDLRNHSRILMSQPHH
jgi:hypothetical protein